MYLYCSTLHTHIHSVAHPRVAQAGPKLTAIFLTQPPEDWDYSVHEKCPYQYIFKSTFSVVWFF